MMYSLLLLLSPCAHAFMPIRQQQLHQLQQKKQQHGSLTRLPLTTKTNPSADDLVGKLIHQKAFHRLRDDSDVFNPRAMSMEERIVLKPNFSRKVLEPFGSRVLIFRNDRNEQVLRFRVHETEQCTLQSSTIATILYLACDAATAGGGGGGFDDDYNSRTAFFQERVLELNSQLGLAGLLGALCVEVVTTTNTSNNKDKDEIDILPEKTKKTTKSPFPSTLTSLTLSDDDPKALHLAAMNVKQVTTDNRLVKLLELDWRHHPRMHPGKQLYRSILGSDLSENFPTVKELARTVAYHLEPQIGRFVHVGPDSLLLSKFLNEGYLMRVDARYVTLESHIYHQQVLPEGEMPVKEFELQRVKEQTMEVLHATHHPDYDGINGEFFFPMETGTFENPAPDKYLEKERGPSPWK